MANPFRKNVEDALMHLDNPDALRTPRKWYRNGPRGRLHSRRSCYKCESWTNQEVTLTAEEAAKKRTCANCCELDTVLTTEQTRAATNAAGMSKHLDASESELAKAGAGDVGSAISHLDHVDAVLSHIGESEADHIGKTIVRIRERAKALRAQANVGAEGLRASAVEWTATALLRRSVLRDETAIPGVEGNDIVVFGANRSEKSSNFDFILGRIYLRWSRHRKEGQAVADTAATAMLDEAVLEKPQQLDFPVDASAGNVTLLEWSHEAWKKELRERLEGRLIPVWEKAYTQLVSRTALKLVGIHGEVNRDETRSLLAAFSAVQRGSVRLVLVPEVVAEYITASEKRWSSDIVEVTEGCEPDLLDTVAALWEPQAREGEFKSLENALRAASAV